MRRISIKGLIHKADAVFSKYIKLLNTKDGTIQCFTCGRYLPSSFIDCGHYITRGYKNTRWVEENAEPQCRSCNRFHEGVKDIFAINLMKKYGEDILRELNDKKGEVKKWTREDIEQIIEIYSLKIKEMKNGNLK